MHNESDQALSSAALELDKRQSDLQTPEPAAFVALVAPATVKKFAATPVKVYPAFGVIVIVAV